MRRRFRVSGLGFKDRILNANLITIGTFFEPGI